MAFYLSGQLLTEDYYVANKLAKGFIGTPHVDTNSRLCMASSVAGHRRAFGADIVPQCYDDLELADLVVLVGSNAAWCHPVLYQRIQMARSERGVRVVNIDPRRTATSEGADLHLSIRPGTDAQLWNGLLCWLFDRGALDQGVHRRSHGGISRRRSMRRAPSAAACRRWRARPGSRVRDVETFYRWWTETQRVVSCYSQGVNQSAQGTDKVNAIINCHLATGRIGKPGSGPLSLTGQPNAMGGREVGGLANMLAAHMGYSELERDRVRRFWGAPNLARSEGLKAVQMFDAIADGRIKALWVMGTNPAVSLPRADHVREAMRRLDLLVVSDNVASNDSVNLAQVRLPASAWGEKDGTVTNSERRISRQRPFLSVAGGGAARLVDAQPGRRADGLGRRILLSLGGGRLPRACHAVGLRERRLAGVRHLRARPPCRRGLRRACRRCNGRCGSAVIGDRAAVRRWRPSRSRPAAAPRCRQLRAGSPMRASADWPFAAQHGAGARPVAHHDAHRHEPAPCRARRRAVRGDAPQGRRGARPANRPCLPASRPRTGRRCCASW